MTETFSIVRARLPQRPLVFDSPHSGWQQPADWNYTAPESSLKTSWDAYVDELFGDAPDFGAVLLHAHFPRSFIDLNRGRTDLDAALLASPWPEPLTPTGKTALGQGLIRSFALPGVPVYDRKLTVAEVQERIAVYYDPYHAALRAELDRLHGDFDAVWHVDCHSMKSRGNAMNDDPGQARPDFVISDRDGTTADPAFTAYAADALRRQGYNVQVNHPYKGAELVRRFSDPAHGRHSIQIEINRALYMNEQTFEKSDGFSALREHLAELIKNLTVWVDTHADGPDSVRVGVR